MEGKLFKKILKSTTYILIFSFFAISLSGCSIIPTKKTIAPSAALVPTGKLPTQIVVWSFEEEDAWKPIKATFESENPGYTLIYKKEVLDTNYENRVFNSMLSGLGPDVWSMPNDWVYRHKEKLAPMPSTTDPKTKVATVLQDVDKIYVPAISQSVKFDNVTYALTPSIEPLVLYWNRVIFQNTLEQYLANHTAPGDQKENARVEKLLSSPPSNWTDFTETAKLLTKRNGAFIAQSGVAMGTKNVANSQDIVYLLMFQNGTEITSQDLKLATFNLSKDTTSGLKDIPGKRAFDFYTSFADPSSANYSWNDVVSADTVDAFATGKTVMFFGYGSQRTILTQKYPDFGGYSTTFAPQIGQDQYSPKDFARFNAFGVSSVSNNIPVSWNLLLKIAGDYAGILDSARSVITGQLGSETVDTSTRARVPDIGPDQIESLTSKTLVKGRNPVFFDREINNAIAAINSKIRDSGSVLDLAALTLTDLFKSEDWLQ